MKYLQMESEAAAAARSQAAWLIVHTPQPGESTIYLWGWLVHYLDGRVLMQIPDTPEDAQISMSQEDYDALLTPAEHAQLLDELPSGWWGDEI